MRKTYKRKCASCGEKFEAKVKMAKTCSGACRFNLWYKSNKKVAK